MACEPRPTGVCPLRWDPRPAALGALGVRRVLWQQLALGPARAVPGWNVLPRAPASLPVTPGREPDGWRLCLGSHAHVPVAAASDSASRTILTSVCSSSLLILHVVAFLWAPSWPFLAGCFRGLLSPARLWSQDA